LHWDKPQPGKQCALAVAQYVLDGGRIKPLAKGAGILVASVITLSMLDIVGLPAKR
jgi:hypothetical protein